MIITKLIKIYICVHKLERQGLESTALFDDKNSRSAIQNFKFILENDFGDALSMVECGPPAFLMLFGGIILDALICTA